MSDCFTNRIENPCSNILEKFGLPLCEVSPKLFVYCRCNFQENSVPVKARGLYFIISLLRQGHE